MTGAVNVDVMAIRAHADAVQEVATGVAKAQEAATYLAHADDAYGLFVKPYAVNTLGELHDEITRLLDLLTTRSGQVPGTLRTAADTFETQDNASATALVATAAEIMDVA
ncbi:type VII secretion target [Nocardia neocaledoniensis]|uniref:type VII secretion target n=1 Tax=Nocardia neocaledoniensis TaxID=236511 RepID=UPI002457330F|nr:type VII secretion target [Nocardia neocaledoniensis]